MSAPNSAALPNASYVQVGTFGQPANAEGARARLTALGLPVSTSQITRSGKALQIVYAGPFASSADARAALTTTRAAGFDDAILR
jgi:cell division protein FtsN